MGRSSDTLVYGFAAIGAEAIGGAHPADAGEPNMRYAVIMAGGAGTRLWPLSRLSRPKQLLPLLKGKSLLETAVERLEGLFETDKILVITGREYADLVAESLSQLPRDNIIGEPVSRDTANAIALATQLLAGRDRDATMAVFTADHVIRPTEIFAANVRSALDAAEANPEALLTFGIHPTWPHTGLGYIHCGETVSDGVHRVLGFKEKPNHQTARQYVESGQYYWNSGMFVWKLSAIDRALRQYLPDSMEKLAPVFEAARKSKDPTAILDRAYPKLQKISIDYAVMEKVQNALMVELRCEWLDIGAWPALENVTELDEAGNVVLAQNTSVTDSFRNMIVSEDDHLLAVLGMDDCIIAHSKDATLVCNKSDSQRLKELVSYIEQTYGGKYV